MDYGIRDTNLPPVSIQQSEETSVPTEEQKKTSFGIAADQDSIETGNNSNSVFTTDPIAGQVSFGDGVEGSRLPEGDSNIQASYRSGLGEAGNVGFPELLKESKIQIFNYLSGQSIDSQMQGAKEKADLAMQQATTGLVTGIVPDASSIRSVVSGLNAYAENAKFEIAAKTAGVADQQLESRYQSVSKLLQQHANEMELQMQMLENQADKDSDSAKASPSHTDQMRDAILDLLRKLSEISRSANGL